ncbi:hypothetical protein HOLleu_15664 [Holothuria leucospilota]|uniref:Uncharacterized protein n=1 Tax=Holothuria leucospilota TaxID=206669 RepID=A0A9Q1C504_HOLLE|nr:hypothetical protein HOLleu_15664 [Holothuria leucospilota]
MKWRISVPSPLSTSPTLVYKGYVYVEEDGDYWRITANGIPDHDTGEFPGSGGSSSIVEQDYDYLYLARTPTNSSFR